MKLRTVINLLLAALLALGTAGCKPAAAENGVAQSAQTETNAEVMTMNVKINGKNFTAQLENNAAAKALAQQLPLALNMKDLHGNEKYYYLPAALPTQAQKVREIKAGDIMLFGSDCLVVFYKSFATPYSYTRLGRIENTDGLEQAVGRGTAAVEFSLR